MKVVGIIKGQYNKRDPDKIEGQWPQFMKITLFGINSGVHVINVSFYNYSLERTFQP